MPPTEIRKVLITAFGDASNVKVVNDTLEDPSSGQVQVKVLYSGFNGSDINMRRGTYPLQKKAPLTPGYCLVGTVSQNGPSCTKFRTGDLVACMSIYDAEATYANLPEKYLTLVPAGLDLQQATALILDWNTAYGMVTRAARVTLGQKVFVHGMSGAVGYAVMMLCKMAGAEVYGTASERNHEAIRALGATPFTYKHKDWIGEMQRLGGVQAVFDPLGFESWDESWSIVSCSGGILVGYGGNLSALNDEAKSRSVAIPVAKLMAKNLNVWSKKRTNFYYISRDDKHFEPDLKALFDLAAQGKIQASIKRVITLDEVPQAHKDWTSLTGMGSVVVTIG